MGRRLNNVHNSNNPIEQEFMRVNFPYDKDILKLKKESMYVKGLLMPTRSIGDL